MKKKFAISRTAQLIKDCGLDESIYLSTLSPNDPRLFGADQEELKRRIESISLIENMRGLHYVLDLKYWEAQEYLDNSERLDIAIADLRGWFCVGEYVVLKTGNDRSLKKITGLFRDECLAECDDMFGYPISCIRHATLEEKRIMERIDRNVDASEKVSQ